MNPADSYMEFATWLDGVFSRPIPGEALAFVFNLYEDANVFHVQLIACGAFDEESGDWASDEVFSSGEDLFALRVDAAGEGWLKALSVATALVDRYLAGGIHAATLKRSKAVAVGFVDGDLDVVWKGG